MTTDAQIPSTEEQTAVPSTDLYRDLPELHQAAAAGDVERVEALLRDGADPNERAGGVMYTPLHLAIMEDHLEVVEVLLDGGADVNATNRIGRTALHFAAGEGRAAIVSILLTHGADVSAQDQAPGTPCQYAAIGGHDEITRMLLAAGAPMTIHIAAALGDLSEIEDLLASEARVDDCDSMGWTPLHYAAATGQMAAARLLLAEGAAVHGSCGMSMPPLFHAAQSGHLEMVQLLIERGVDVNAAVAIAQETALHGSAGEGKTDVVAYLIEHGADVDALTMNSFTPLHQAVRAGDLESVRLLLAAGARTDVRDDWTRTALDLAERRGLTEIADLIREHDGGTQQPSESTDDPAGVEPEYRAAATELLTVLKIEHPEIEFAIEWNQQRLQVQMENVSIGEPESHPEPQTVNLFRSIICSCVQTLSPPTQELWISTSSGGERGQWEDYERAMGVTTPHPDSS